MTRKGNDIVKEIRELAPDMPHLGNTPEFSVPEGYFDAFPARLMQQVRSVENSAAITEELETVAPFLANMPRQSPFTAPEGYFNRITADIIDAKTGQQPGKVVKMQQRLKLFKRCLAAALIAGIVSVGAVMVVQRYSATSIDRQMAAVSDQEIVDYLQRHTDAFDNDNIFATVSLEEEMPEVLPEDLSTSEIDEILDENLFKEELPSEIN